MAAPKHVFVTYIRTTPDALWNALMASEFTDPDRTVVSESQPFRRFVCAWREPLPDGTDADERPSRVTYEIDPLGAVCRLTIVHDDFHGVTRGFGLALERWPRVLAVMKTRLETGTALVIEPSSTHAGDESVDVDVEDHRDWARRSNGRTWELLESPSRTDAEQRELLEVAYASAWHWRHAGTAVNEQRAEWLLSRVHAALGDPGAALLHARRCLDITDAEGLVGFDRAYAYEAMARATALAGADVTAKEWRDRAVAAADEIDNAEDREIFMSDLDAAV
jgi:hypothetical protein